MLNGVGNTPLHPVAFSFTSSPKLYPHVSSTILFFYSYLALFTPHPSPYGESLYIAYCGKIVVWSVLKWVNVGLAVVL
jgi:hypothetical protein